MSLTRPPLKFEHDILLRFSTGTENKKIDTIGTFELLTKNNDRATFDSKNKLYHDLVTNW